jgi:hypothetical protein
MYDRPSVLARFLGRPPKPLNWTVVAWVVAIGWVVLACALYIAPSMLSH